MSTKTWTTSVTLQSSLNNFFQGSSLALTHQRVQTATDDVGSVTLDIDADEYQDVYKAQDNTGGAPGVVYLYVNSSANNQGNINIAYVSASVEIIIAQLQPGDWMYIPYRPQGSSYNASWIRARNLSATNEASVAVLFGESGSFI